MTYPHQIHISSMPYRETQNLLQNHIHKKVLPVRLKYKGGVREVARDAIRIVLLDATPQEAKDYFNYLIDAFEHI